MSNPIIFPAVSPRFGLPLLFAGQAQKEFSVNEAHALTDALLHCAIEGELADPPVTPSDGTAWLIGPVASGEWSGHEGSIVCRQGGNWLYVTPCDGMRVLDRSSGQMRMFLGSWQIAAVPTQPIGGAVIDSEARAAILQLIGALRTAGVLPT
jgi:Protein of unknown function (DUF2793)